MHALIGVIQRVRDSCACGSFENSRTNVCVGDPICFRGVRSAREKGWRGGGAIKHCRRDGV